MKTITSVHNESLRQLAKLLSSAKARRESGLAVLEGVHLLDACLNAGGSLHGTPGHTVRSLAGLGDDADNGLHRGDVAGGNDNLK